MTALLAIVGSSICTGLLKALSDRILFYLAIKALLIAICTVLIPIVVNNIISGYLQDAIDAMAALNTSGLNGSMSFSGWVGYLLDCFNIPECLSIIVGAIQLHITLKLIPFSPIK